MPELPEVETVRTGLRPYLLGRVVEEVEVDGSERFTPATLSVGRTVEDVTRRGKYLVVDLGDTEMIVHLGMTGILQLDEPGVALGHVRVRWHLDDNTTIVLRDARKFGRVSVVPRGEYQTLPTLDAMGPEPLSGAFDAKAFTRTLQGKDATVKSLLLDQRIVAGLGNIYVDESLWDARIHPNRRGRTLTLPEGKRLHQAIRDALESGLRRRGTTLRDYRTFDGGSGSNQDHLKAYGRSGLPCERCGDLMVKSVVAGRGTTYCPRCQRPPKG